MFPLKPSQFKICNSVESYDEKTAENYRYCNVAEKRIVSRLSEISIPSFNNTNLRLEARFCQNFTSLSFIFSDELAVKERYGRVKPNRFIANRNRIANC